jgi:uncharacterized membrane-anchored protein YitT (DUF2179 family)
MQSGKVMMIIGLAIFMIGGLIFLARYFGFPLGNLPGDIRIQRENVSCFFPLSTMLFFSVLLTIILNLVIRLWKK